jgi:hypothetical protein
MVTMQLGLLMTLQRSQQSPIKKWWFSVCILGLVKVKVSLTSHKVQRGIKCWASIIYPLAVVYPEKNSVALISVTG